MEGGAYVAIWCPLDYVSSSMSILSEATWSVFIPFNKLWLPWQTTISVQAEIHVMFTSVTIDLSLLAGYPY